MRAACLALAAVFSGAVFAQSGGPAPEFVVADVHSMAPDSDPYEGNYTVSGGFYRGGIYELRHATIVDLIRIAWGVDASRVVGGPDWVRLDQFDVVGTAPEDTTPEDLNLMLRGLLKDRFQLALHESQKDFPAWALTAGSKPQLKPSEGHGEGSCQPQAQDGAGDGRSIMGADGTIRYACRDVTMAAFAALLPRVIGGPQSFGGVPVVDRTALDGGWDFDIRFTPPRLMAPANAAEPVSIFDAVDKQLGLKLQKVQIPTPVLAIDSVNEKPTDNPPGVTAKLPASPLEFEVAAIKPFDHNAVENGGFEFQPTYQPGGRVYLQDDTLRTLIARAWHIGNIDTIVGPKFLDTKYFGIMARASVPDFVPGHQPVGAVVNYDAMDVMLQNLLKDRFKLALHFEDRTAQGYALVAAKPKLHPTADPAAPAGCKEGPGADGKDPRIANPAAGRLVTCLNMTVGQFATELRTRAGGYLYQYTVVDATGIEGHYDFTINFSVAGMVNGAGRGLSAGPPGGDAMASDPNGAISVFEALEKQLGLKLESRKVAAQVLIVEHVEETPTEN